MSTETKGGIPSVGRKNNYLVMPEDLYVEEREGYPYYDPRHSLPVSEESILFTMVYGVKEALKVVKADVEGFGVRTVVIHGRQRRKMAIEANIRLKAQGEEPMAVECSYDKDNDEDKAHDLNVALNRHRINDTMMDDARIAYDYLTKRGKTVSQVAQLMNVSLQTVRDWEALMGCTQPVKKAIFDGKLQPTAAIKLAKLNPVQQKVELNALIEKSGGKKITVNDAKRAVAKVQGKLPERDELVAKARKAINALNEAERTALFEEFRQPSMVEDDDA